MEYKPQPDRYTNGMLYRRCGDSGIQLPVISLGFWHNFGNTDCYATGLELVEYAFDHGVCHYFTATDTTELPPSMKPCKPSSISSGKVKPYI